MLQAVDAHTTISPTVRRLARLAAGVIGKRLPGVVASDAPVNPAVPALLGNFARARHALPVTVSVPTDGASTKTFRGILRGAMYARGGLHHYRVVDGEGQMFLVPPHWIADDAPDLLPAASAGIEAAP